MGLLSDEHLARRAAQGDQRAFEAIYRRYHQRLYRFCLALVGNRQDAQDALQNTMVKALRSLPGDQRQIKLKPWLYRIARNESIEVLRRRRESSELDPQLEAAGGVAETAESRQKLRDLLGDLEQLPERQRSVLVMRELSGLGFAEIGAALDTSAAVVRQALYEARLSLRQLEAGREMRCGDVMRELSDADGRTVRRREIRSHLRSCPDCRAFHDGIGRRRGELAAIAPLPLAASAGLLHGVLGAQTSAGAAAASIGAGTGAAVATSTIVKSAATVAVATVVGVSAADRGGLVDLPLPGGGNGGAASETSGSPRGGGDSPGVTTTPAVAPSVGVAGGGPLPAAGQDPREQAEPRPSEKSSAAHDTSHQDPNFSSAGASPPGGGHGSDSSQRRGAPDALPAAASHGQQTATSRRPAHAGSPSSRGEKGSRGGGARPNSAPPAPAKVRPVPPTKPPPPPPPHPLAPPPAAKGAPSPPGQAGQKPVQESGSPPAAADRP